jgi:uncharacterized protein YaiL (DUF2058 family)
MSDSLRDQLLGLGFKPPAKPERRPAQGPARKPAHKSSQGAGARAARDAGKPASGAPRPHGKAHPPRQGKPGTRGDIDLAKAYAIRAQKEKDERIEAERLKQAQARERRAAKARLAGLLEGKALNDPAAEIARHFDYGGKIKRIHVNAAQLKALNAGELGVVQLDGRYLLVDAALLAQAQAIFAPAVALRIDPAAPATDDPYADPRFEVPDDLVW